MTEVLEPPIRTAPGGVTFLELEITSRCQLTCSSHRYAEAGSAEGHGAMTAAGWKQVIDEAAHTGVTQVQFMGGETALHPDFVQLVEHALDREVGLQVYSNLYRVKPEHWQLFERPGVSPATSYYADTDEGHDAVTGRKGSHAATRANGWTAIMPDGTVTPRVLGRFLPTGSVKGGSLKAVFDSDRWDR